MAFDFSNPLARMTHQFSMDAHDLASRSNAATTSRAFQSHQEQFGAFSTPVSSLASQSVLPSSAFLSAMSASAATAHLTGISHDTVQSQITAMKSGVLSHFDMGLAAYYNAQVGADSALMAPGLRGITNSAVHTDAAGKQYVTVDVTVHDQNHNHQIDAAEAQAVLAQLNALGMTNGSTYAGMVSGVIAVDKIAALGNVLSDHDLGFARISAFQTSQGLVDSQADVAEHTNIARSHYGVSGHGIDVGILSDSFDANAGASTHMADDIASHDLPHNTHILQDIGSGSDEGRAMAQLVHDIAPGSGIDFATAFTGQAGFANNILALAASGDQVIADDVIYFAELAYQEGPIAQAINAVAAAGVSYFSSAGNNSHEGLEQQWNNGGPGYFGETLMRFDNGQDYLPITLAAAEVIILQWDTPGASAGGRAAQSDLDLFLTNKDGSKVYALSADFNEGGDPVEGFGISGGSGGTYYLRVGLYSGHKPTEIKLMALGNGRPVDLGTTDGNFNNGTMYGHTSASGSNSVGAVRYDATPEWGINPPDSESFTSAGPTRIWFDNDGHRLAAPDDRNVDFSAADGANTTFFGGDYESDGFGNFFGTSAAAPDAAAVAALMLEANGGLTPEDINHLLGDSALDMDNNNVGGTVGFDNGPDAETGSGFVQGDLAVGFATTLVIRNDDAVVLKGTHFNDTIIGNGNANLIDGGLGDDIIHGGLRGDTMHGGDGYDTFVFDSIFDAIAHVRIDVINDLDDVFDTIDLSQLDADYTAAGNQAFHLVVGAGGDPGDLQVKYHHNGTYAGATTIKGWVNDDGKTDVLIVATGHHETFANFIL